MLRRMLAWLAPGGLAVVEVPNAGGVGARLFGARGPGSISRATSGTSRRRRSASRSSGRAAASCGCWHQAKPRYYLWSLGHWLRDHGCHGLARAAEWRAVYGVLKLALEIGLPLCCWARWGEVIRMGIVPATSSAPRTAIAMRIQIATQRAPSPFQGEGGVRVATRVARPSPYPLPTRGEGAVNRACAQYPRRASTGWRRRRPAR